MYFDALKKKVMATAQARRDVNLPRVDILDCIAPCYRPIHDDLMAGAHSIYYLVGGRGSCKSSFASLELVQGIMDDPNANGLVLRRYANTLRDSTFSQVGWATEQLGVSQLWTCTTNPMQYVYKPTQQVISFRGLDDPSKLKSLHPRKGIYKYLWIEEYNELAGERQVRNVRQSVVRGGDGFVTFASFNPPPSKLDWSNLQIEKPDPRALVFRSDFTMVPEQWLGPEFLAEAEALKAINEKAYAHEYMGQAVDFGAGVFPNVVTRTITDAEVAALQYQYTGVDFGFSTDPLAMVRVGYDAKKREVWLLDELVALGMSNGELADEIKLRGYDVHETEYHTMFEGGTYTEKQTVTCDSAEPKSVADLRALGIKAMPCHKWNGSVRYGIRWLQGRRIIIDPERTPNAWKEFTNYEYAMSRDGEVLGDLVDANNHTIDSVRYALDALITSGRNAA